jgi:general secretion pathway protein G
VAILAIVAALAYPSYASYQERGRIAQATIDIKDMEQRIKLYAVDNRAYPETLAEIGKGGLRDPWGNLYEYTNLETAKGKGAARKNKNLVPINSDFDLYSKGKDGASSSPLTAKPSRDDIVRANDGRFVGLASDYEP